MGLTNEEFRDVSAGIAETFEIAPVAWETWKDDQLHRWADDEILQGILKMEEERKQGASEDAAPLEAKPQFQH